MAIIGPPATSVNTIGLTNPAEPPYNAAMNGTTNDDVPFKKLHEDINSGVIKGYIVTGPVKLTKKPVVLTKPAEIRFFNESYLDFSEMTEEGAAYRFEGSLGATAELTADAAFGAYSLAVATAYSDGTLLKLTQPEENWDTSTSSKMGEIVEVGAPDGGLTGRKVEAGAFAESPIVLGQKITEIRMTNINPEEGAASIIPAAGEIKIGNETYVYTSFTIVEGKVRFVITEKEATEGHPLGSKVTLVSPAGTVFLRTPVRCELGYKKEKKAKVGPITPIEAAKVVDCTVKGPGSKLYLGGIDIIYGYLCDITVPEIKDCWGYGIRFQSCYACNITDPKVINTRWVYYASSGLEGYGIVFTFATQDCTCRGGKTVRTRHSYTQGGGGGEGIPMDNLIEDHKSISAWADAYDSHGGGYSVTFLRCVAINPNGQGFNINCPKVKIAACRVTNAGGYGVLCQSVTPIGFTEYDIDCEVVKCRASGLAVVANSATNGKNTNFVRIRGSVMKSREQAVKVEGFGVGNEVKYYLLNVDIDVQLRESPTTETRLVQCNSCENIRVRVQAEGIEKGQIAVRMQDCKNFKVDLGPLKWTAEAAGNRGCFVGIGAAGAEGGSTNGSVYEGPMTNLGTGKSTEISAAVAKPTTVFVYPGPNEAVDNKGAASCKVLVVP